MSGVNVLAVVDRAAESAGKIVKESNGDFRAVIYQEDLFKARAAIAELIEASKAVHEQMGGPDFDGSCSQMAFDRLDAALAAVSPK